MATLANRNALLKSLGQDEDAYPGDAPMPESMPISRTVENTGIAGDKLPMLDQAMPSAAPMAAAPVQDFGRLNAGYSRDKLNDQNKQSAKYQMGRALSGFDPTKGFNDDSIAALNALGFGNFSAKGGSDKLSLSGLTDKGRQAGLVGDYTDADFIQALKSGNGQWSYQDPAAEAMEGGPAAGGAMGGLDSRLGGDPTAMIQQALAAYSKSPNLQALLAQLGAA